eukprot:COSAG01_NODE_12792_length_1684_cov_23.512303_3_plen_72_part_01
MLPLVEIRIGQLAALASRCHAAAGGGAAACGGRRRARARATADQYSQDSGTIMYNKVPGPRPLQILIQLLPG